MSRIVSAVNAMISNPKKISAVCSGLDNDAELFFLYDGKYKWSMFQDEDDSYCLYYYPTDHDIVELAIWEDWEMLSYVTYKSEDLKTREATESFADLYKLLQEKLYDMGTVLDDIIGDMQD